ncbi:MAG: nucleoside 2-deoxyribosyltransferase [Nitrososphaera sp.]
MKKDKIRIYLASPYGFTDAGREFMSNSIIPSIRAENFEILNPWEHYDSVSDQMSKISFHESLSKQREMLNELNKNLAGTNAKNIEQSDIVIAILDGPDVDSGVASEIGYAYAMGKKIIGYRSDFRLSGDNLAAIVNIQVEYFVRQSGGMIVRNTSELREIVARIRSRLTTLQ